MAKFTLLYSDGSGMAMTPAEEAAVMKEWTTWFGSLGSALADGGAPFGPSAGMIAPNGAVSAGSAMAVTGYTILNADSAEAAIKLAKGCPVLKGGGSITVYPAMAM